MSKRDHEPRIYDEVKGLYSRNDRIAPPDGYLHVADNVVYSPALVDDPANSASIRMRESFIDLDTLPCNPIRFWTYDRTDGTRYMLLDESGQIWDSVSGTVVYTNVDAIDFHGITLNNHFYFSPHNRVTGLDGEAIWLYDPDLNALARKAAGAPLTGTFTGAVSTVNGSIEPGTHIVAISYVTDTGFRSKPALHFSFIAPNPRKKLNLTAIPLGPSNTKERLIWMSHIVAPNFDGNKETVPLYLAYKIENNTTTVLSDTIDPFDSQLITSADPYIDLLPELPAGTFLTNFDGRLVICGSKTSPHTLYISNPNEPENIDAVDGVKEIAKGDGEGVNTTRSWRGNLICWKSERTGILRPNEGTPTEWSFEMIDSALGAEVYSVSEVMNAPGMFFEVFLVANKLGLNVFNGAYQNVLKPLSHNIVQVWRPGVNASKRTKTKVLVDPVNFRIYVLLYREGTTHWLYGDFSGGLNYENIKWSEWKFDYPLDVHEDYFDAHVINDNDINKHNTVVLAIVSGSNKLRYFVTASVGAGVDAGGDVKARFGMKFADPELGEVNIAGMRMHLGAQLGNNTGEYGFRGNTVFDPIEPDNVNTVVERFTNNISTSPSIEFLAEGGDFNITRFIVYIAKQFAESARLR